MTEQTFHITGLHPRSALCGRGSHIWAGPDWPSDDDMRNGRFCAADATSCLRPPRDPTKERTQPGDAAGGLQYRLARGCGLPAGPGGRNPDRSRRPRARSVQASSAGRRHRGRQARPRRPVRRPASAILNIRRRKRHNGADAMTASDTHMGTRTRTHTRGNRRRGRDPAAHRGRRARDTRSLPSRRQDQRAVGTLRRKPREHHRGTETGGHGSTLNPGQASTIRPGTSETPAGWRRRDAPS